MTTNTTIFEGLLAELAPRSSPGWMDAGVDGMMISPGYSYDKAPGSTTSSLLERTRRCSGDSCPTATRAGVQPVAVVPGLPEGKVEPHCTPWGMPTYSIFGWQRPCYLFRTGYGSLSRS